MLTVSKLDFYFPFFVFFYGLVVVFILENKYFTELAKNRMPNQYVQFLQHQKIAWFSVYAGGLWSIQNLWFS